MSDSETETRPKVQVASQDNDPDQNRKKKIWNLVGSISAVTIVVIFASLAGTNNLKISRTDSIDIEAYGDKVAFVCKYLIIHTLWLLIAIVNVAYGRGKAKAFNPLEGRDHMLQAQKNVLQNSIEQSLLSISTQLGLAAYLSAETLINVIPIMNILYLIGRIGFILGYPDYRAFGFQLTFFPTVIAMFYSIYKLIATEFT